MRLLVFTLSAFAAASAVVLNATVSATAAYNVTVDGSVFLIGDAYALRQDGALLTSRPGGGLLLDGPVSPASGATVLGPWSGWTASFNNGLMQVTTQMLTLPSGAPAIIFEQYYPRGVNGTQVPDRADAQYDVASAFPSFTINDAGASPAKAYLTMSGGMCPSTLAPFSVDGAEEGLLGLMSGVATVFTPEVALTISPLNHFLVSSIYFPPSLATDGQHPLFTAGLSGRLDYIPVGWRHATILVAPPPAAPAASVNASVHAWGDALLLAGGVKSRIPVDGDFHTAHLSVYTDNGSLLYYNPLPNTTLQDTVLLEKQYVLEELSLPVRSFQYDSYWYYKSIPRSGALTEWAAMPDVFPAGYTSNWLGMPTAAHSKFFAPNNTYATTSGCQFHAEPSVNMSIPVDGCAYTAMLAPAVASWDLCMLEVDWLSYTYQQMNITQTDPYAAAAWMSSINDGAVAHGITVQLCMALPNQMLHTSVMPSVTNARASGDYSSDPAQWAIGTTSIFFSALGVQPFKDVFRTTEVQGNNPYQEPNWLLEALSATLSTAAVAFGDAINATNASVIMRTCRGGVSDGLILKPDAPAVTLDAALQAAAFPAAVVGAAAAAYVIPDVVAAHSDHVLQGSAGNGWARWSYLYAARLSAPFPISLDNMGGAGTGASSALMFDYFNVFGGPVAMLQASNASSIFTIPTGQGQPSAPAAAYTLRYYIVAPVLSSTGNNSGEAWAVVGEVDKFTTMSKQRVSSVSINEEGLTVVLKVGNGETTALNYAVAHTPGSDSDWSMLPVTCVPVSAQPVLTLSCAAGSSTCTCG